MLGALGGGGALVSVIGLTLWSAVGVVLTVTTVGAVLWLRRRDRSAQRAPRAVERVDLAVPQVPTSRR